MALSQDIKDSLRQLQATATGVNDDNETSETMADVVNVAKSMSLKDYSTLAKAGLDGITNKMVDDRTYLMENIIQLVAGLPTESVLSNTLTHKFLNQLWTDLQHPPQSYLGKDYSFRTPDGSRNNFLWPHIGSAGQPYARSVTSSTLQPPARPDPGVVFDALLKREKWKPHPNKISSVLFYVASIIIHDIFHTSHTDPNVSNTSSYLDLAPLYGSSLAQQRAMRTMSDGKLKPDCFSDQRILGFPPGVGLILIFFNRFHNEQVEKLAQIDENGRFSRVRHPSVPPPNYDGEKEYDEALFQTARLITSGLYINIILQDYVRTILNLNRSNTKWNLDPRSEQGKAIFGEKIPVATGNQVSAEFNLVYRWHSTASKRDVKWTETIAAKIFPPAAEDTEASMKDFLEALRQWAYKMSSDPLERDFDGLERDKKTGCFRNEDLAALWTASVEDVAGAFGANHVPEVLKMVEVLGITQARSWNLASLNEFRKFFKLQPHETFESINPDRDVQQKLKHLYGHPDNVELYPGIIVEATKVPMVPGSGLCTNFTISRAILSDAVALVRGDRFYTVDYTPYNLTNYGFTAAGYDTDVDDGGVFYKLILSALPHQYQHNSIYVHYPLTTPGENQQIMKNRRRDHLYDFQVPSKQPEARRINTFDACKALFSSAGRLSSEVCMTPTTPRANARTGAPGDGDKARSLATLRRYLTTNPNKKYVVQFFENITSDLLQKHSYWVAGVQEVDIIQNVANLAQVHFAACMFALPLKTDNNPGGAFEAEELWALLTGIYSTTYSVSDPAERFRTRIAVQGAIDSLGEMVVENVKSAHPDSRGWSEWAANLLHHQHSSDLTDQSTHLIQNLLKTGADPEKLAYQCLLPVAATIVVSQARGFADCLTYLLRPNGDDSILESIQKLAVANTGQADTQIELIMLEALRMNSRTSMHVEIPGAVHASNSGLTHATSASETVILDMAAVQNDAAVFDEANRFSQTRSTEMYLPGLPSLPPTCPGQELGRPALVGMLKAIMRLPNLRRSKGPIGKMKVIIDRDGTKMYMNRDETSAHLYPSSMKVNFGGVREMAKRG